MFLTLLSLSGCVAGLDESGSDSAAEPSDDSRVVGPADGTVLTPVGSCGSAPAHAPPDCGSQQWTEYSSHLPAAVGWFAIANTGTRTCTVTITKIELSYSSPSGSTVLKSTQSGAQRLYDGTTATFGTYKSDETVASSYTIPASSGYYIHPFTGIAEVPTDATKLTFKYAATIGSGCVVEAGIDTYQRDAIPTTSSPYTTDVTSEDFFIKEAIKSAWTGTTISSASPSSLQITRHAAPASVTAAACYNAATVSWSKPSDESPDASHPYKVFHSTSTFDSSSYDPDIPGATVWKSTTSTSQAETGLAIGTREYYAVYATGSYTYAPADDLHSALAWTSVTPANFTWATPTSAAYTGPGSLLLKWKSASSMQSACSAFIKDYYVEQGTVNSAGTCTFSTNFYDPIDYASTGGEDATQLSGIGGLTSGKKYCFRVSARLTSLAVSNKSATLTVVSP